MAENSNIEWTDGTDNIVVVEGGGWWCRMINLLCIHCYAAALNMNTFYGGNQMPYRGAPPKLKLRRDLIASWARQRKPRKHFVASMTDVFGEWVARAWQFEFLDGMLAAPLQTFQLLTKRTGVMLKAVKYWMAARGITEPPRNIWLGFSAGNQETFDEAWADVKQLAAMGWTVFASLEPMLGPITLPDDFLAYGKRVQVITGGESGTKARPAHPDWFYSLRDQCHAAGVPFFFKQWGEWAPACELNHVEKYPRKIPHAHMNNGGVCQPVDSNVIVCRVGKKRTGRILQGQTWSQMPEAIR